MKIFSKLIFSVSFILVSIFSNSIAEGSQSKNLTTFDGNIVSTYLIGKYIDTDTAIKKLKNAGFEILTVYKPVKNGRTIVFTNSALKSEAAKTGRSFAAVLRLFVDEKKKMISFTNPIYFGKAFMQGDYNHAVFKTQLETINKVFPNLKGSIDKLKFDDLSEYNFMIGMPHYSDVNELGSASHEILLSRARNYKKGKLLLFELKLSPTSTLLGYDLGRRTKKFIKKIGRENAAVLPYCISVENSKATALDAKYYLALSYPLLSMNKFMSIATIPGAIVKELQRPFKK